MCLLKQITSCNIKGIQNFDCGDAMEIRYSITFMLAVALFIIVSSSFTSSDKVNKLRSRPLLLIIDTYKAVYSVSTLQYSTVQFVVLSSLRHLRLQYLHNWCAGTQLDVCSCWWAGGCYHLKNLSIATYAMQSVNLWATEVIWENGYMQCSWCLTYPWIIPYVRRSSKGGIRRLLKENCRQKRWTVV